MPELMSPTRVPHLIASHVVSTAKYVGPGVDDLADAVAEVTVQTQIYGASILTVRLIDPEWAILTSGFLNVDQDGLLDTIEVEFPEGSGSSWRLVAIDFSSDLSAPNVTLTFEDRIVAYLRDHWGPKTAPAGLTTRAQFLKVLVDEVHPPKEKSRIKFVCPEINIVQPVASIKTIPFIRPTPTSGVTPKSQSPKPPAGLQGPEGLTPVVPGLHGPLGITATVASKHVLARATRKANKQPGIGHGAAIKIKGLDPTSEQIEALNDALAEAANLNAGRLATEALVCAGIGESNFKPSAVNGQYKGVFQANQVPPNDTTLQAHYFLVGGKGFQGGGAMKLARDNPAMSPGTIAYTVEGNRSNFNSDQQAEHFYGQWLDDARAIIAAGGGIPQGQQSTHRTPGASSNKSDVSQLTRGTTTNPDENSWDAMTRLAQEVNWFLFSNADTLYYMTGPELAAQQPALYLKRDGTSWTATLGTGAVNDDVVAHIDGRFDNTAFIFQETRTIKGKVQHASRTAKPTTPAEIRVNLICDVDEVRAGDVIVIQQAGPASGRWIVADATRNVLGDIFTQLTLVPPTAPAPEPAATPAAAAATKSATSTTTGAALSDFGADNVARMALKALDQKAKYRYGQVRPMPDSLFGPAPRTLDCSAFATLCYKAGGLPDPNGPQFNYDGSGNTSTLISNADKVQDPQPGDLCFFGDKATATTHVSVYVGNGEAVSMGKPGDPEKGPAKTTGPSGFLGYWRPRVTVPAGPAGPGGLQGKKPAPDPVVPGIAGPGGING